MDYSLAKTWTNHTPQRLTKPQAPSNIESESFSFPQKERVRKEKDTHEADPRERGSPHHVWDDLFYVYSFFCEKTHNA
jgi:hypothetical protein